MYRRIGQWLSAVAAARTATAAEAVAGTVAHTNALRECLFQMVEGKEFNRFHATFIPGSIVALERDNLAPKHIFRELPGKIFRAKFTQRLASGERYIEPGEITFLCRSLDADRSAIVVDQSGMRDQLGVLAALQREVKNIPGAQLAFVATGDVVHLGKHADWFRGSPEIDTLNRRNFRTAAGLAREDRSRGSTNGVAVPEESQRRMTEIEKDPLAYRPCEVLRDEHVRDHVIDVFSAGGQFILQPAGDVHVGTYPTELDTEFENLYKKGAPATRNP